MSENCCTQQEKLNESLLTRSVFFVAAGLLMLIPLLESILISSWLRYIFFTLSTLSLAISIHRDFTDHQFFCVLVIFSFSCILIAPIFLTNIYSILLLASGILLCLLTLFLKTAKEIKFFKSFFNTTNLEIKYSQYFEFPSTKKLILIFIMSCWATSFASFFSIFSAVYSITVQESFFLYGSYGISSYIMNTMQSKILPHNHREKIIARINDNEASIFINEIKQGMLLSIEKETLIPVSSTTQTECIISHDGEEKRVTQPQGSTLPKNVFIHKGTILCEETFIPTSHADQRKQTEKKDYKLNFMLLTTLAISFISGIFHGIQLSSAAIGLKYFASNLIVACPCVFFVVKAIFSNKFLNWVNKKVHINFNKMPTKGKPNIFVFDRTHTLYEENPNNPQGEYILNKDAKKLLYNLKKSGVTCYILSGHQNDTHLENCKTELTNLIEPSNIIFNNTYHDPKKSAKKDIIKNLQLYGSITKPNNLVDRIYHYFINIFSPKVVGMMGDGENDIKAMKQSDFAISISKKSANINNNVLKESNFHINQTNILDTYDLLEASNQTYKFTNFFTNVGFLINILMLIAINFSILSSATACVFMPLICTALIVISTQINFNISKQLPYTLNAVEACNPIKNSEQPTQTRRPSNKTKTLASSSGCMWNTNTDTRRKLSPCSCCQNNA